MPDYPARAAALRILRQHTQGQAVNPWPGEQIELAGAHLEEAGLTGTHLEGTDFRQTRLVGASLEKAHLDGM